MIHRYAESDVPTEYGVVRLVVYRTVAPGSDNVRKELDPAPGNPHPSVTRATSVPSPASGGGPGRGSSGGSCAAPAAPGASPEEHVAIVVGSVQGASEAVLVRVHSECWTGEVLHSKKCDCRAQLDIALRTIADAGRGVVVYLRQEGRGIGLGNKVRAYALQEEGADTVDANRLLGFADDARTYDVAAAILSDLGVGGVRLLTNNPRKVEGLSKHGIHVVERVPLTTEPNEHNAEYLAVKARRMGHEL